LRQITSFDKLSNITNERNIYRSMTQALKDIGKYCDDYDIKITKLDSIKLLKKRLGKFSRRLVLKFLKSL
jgi:hypothetical protein